MKAFAKLNQSICILHPLSYLIKNSNFNSLKQFTEKYKLIKIPFSSSLFPDLRKIQNSNINWVICKRTMVMII